MTWPEVLKETSSTLIDTNPCCCKIRIKRVDRISDITVSHTSRELSRFIFYVIHKGISVTGSFANITTKPIPFPEGHLESTISMHFVYKNNAIFNKLKALVIEETNQMQKHSSLIRWYKVLGLRRKIRK